MTEPIRYRHCILAGFCKSGVKIKCRMLGLSYEKLMREGYTIEELPESVLRDSQVQTLVEFMKKEF